VILANGSRLTIPPTHDPVWRVLPVRVARNLVIAFNLVLARTTSWSSIDVLPRQSMKFRLLPRFGR
jgi:hypothetical protein